MFTEIYNMATLTSITVLTVLTVLVSAADIDL